MRLYLRTFFSGLNMKDIEEFLYDTMNAMTFLCHDKSEKETFSKGAVEKLWIKPNQS